MLGDGAFQLAGVVFDLGGDVADDVVGQADAAHAGLFLQDGDAGFVAGLFDAGDEAPVEAADEPLFQLGDFAGRAVGTEDDLLLLLVERVEGVEEFFLGPDVLAEEMDVVDHQQVDVAVAIAELAACRRLDDGADELVDEAVAGEIEDAQIALALEDLLADGLEQVGLAETDAAVDEEGVVGLARVFGDGDASGVGELVAGAGDELLEDIIGVEGQGLVAVVEKAAAAEAFAMKGDGDQAAE